jgi:hypothetical protein
MAATFMNNCQRMEQRNSLAFIYECSHLQVQVGNFLDHPRMYGSKNQGFTKLSINNKSND